MSDVTVSFRPLSRGRLAVLVTEGNGPAKRLRDGQGRAVTTKRGSTDRYRNRFWRNPPKPADIAPKVFAAQRDSNLYGRKDSGPTYSYGASRPQHYGQGDPRTFAECANQDCMELLKVEFPAKSVRCSYCGGHTSLVWD